MNPFQVQLHLRLRQWLVLKLRDQARPPQQRVPQQTLLFLPQVCAATSLSASIGLNLTILETLSMTRSRSASSSRLDSSVPHTTDPSTASPSENSTASPGNTTSHSTSIPSTTSTPSPGNILSHHALSVGAAAGLSVAAVVFLALIVAVLRYTRKQRRLSTERLARKRKTGKSHLARACVDTFSSHFQSRGRLRSGVY